MLIWTYDEGGGYYDHVPPPRVIAPDHTSVLKLVETKWNLPALTYRDANASNLLDALDLDDAPPNFLDPPSLAAAPGRSTCVEGSPGLLPPGADPT